MLTKYSVIVGLLVIATGFVVGCAVPQPRGRGTKLFMVDEPSNRGYYLYLPRGYNPSRSWPLVVTFHGMKPFDHAESQELEWETLADAYQMIVLAPDLHNSDLFMQYPLRNVNEGVLNDERVALQIIEHVVKRCNVDRSRLFATSWSSGGYFLHYVVSNNPDVFAGFCARGSNFSLELAKKVSRQKVLTLAERKTPVLIYYGSNDFSAVRRESEQAVEWYRGLKLPVRTEIVRGAGHERVPELAAKFFAQYGGAARSEQQGAEILASYDRGLAPFWVNFSAKLFGVDRRDYGKFRFVWSVDGKVEGSESSLSMTINQPGDHMVKLQVITPEQQSLEAYKSVVVIPHQSVR